MNKFYNNYYLFALHMNMKRDNKFRLGKYETPPQNVIHSA